MTNLPDAFHLDSGLREDAILTVHASYFAPSADYQDGKVLMLHLIGTDENDDELTIKMSVGADWTTPDTYVITHPTKRRQNINGNTIYGHWLEESLNIPTLAQHLITVSDSKYSGLGPRDARIWQDVILHLQSKEYTWNIRGQEPTTRSYLMPTEYLGQYVQPDATPAPATPAPAAVPAPAPATDIQAQIAAARAAASPATTNGSPWYNKALDIARSAPDFPTFVAQAFEVPEILADDELATQVADEAQIWAQAH